MVTFGWASEELKEKLKERSDREAAEDFRLGVENLRKACVNGINEINSVLVSNGFDSIGAKDKIKEAFEVKKVLATFNNFTGEFLKKVEEITSLKTELASLRVELETFTNEFLKKVEEIASLRIELETFNNSFLKKADEIASLKGELGSLRIELDTANSMNEISARAELYTFFFSGLFIITISVLVIKFSQAIFGDK